MATMKYDIPLLDRDTRFALWQVKMRAVLAQADLDDALDKFGNKDSKTWSDDEKKKDSKALSHIHLHLSNNILQEVLQEKTAAALWLKLESICMSKDLTSKMHMKMKLYMHKLQEGGSVSTHLSSLRRSSLTYSLWRYNMRMRTWVLFFCAHCLVILQTSEILYCIVVIL
jgi:hypothetical protein